MPSAEYLSGDVRIKLDQARAAAARDTSLEHNVMALERVLPPDLGSRRDRAQARGPPGSTPTPTSSSSVSCSRIRACWWSIPARRSG
ncbi:MAG TPA: hypothetical protein VED41_10435, partial [Solirubrobacteraceae bacterium]|nr:hypothetical protein [Solirubrobacteraceae bacterium]